MGRNDNGSNPVAVDSASQVHVMSSRRRGANRTNHVQRALSHQKVEIAVTCKHKGMMTSLLHAMLAVVFFPSAYWYIGQAYRGFRSSSHLF